MAETTRDEFLRDIRAALHRTPTTPVEPYPPASETVAALRQRAAEARARIDERRGELVEQLCGMATKVGWNLVRVANHEQAVEALRVLSDEGGWRTVVRSDHPVFDRLSLTDRAPFMAVDLRVMAMGIGGSRGALREAASGADAGLTGVDFAMAETATAVLLPRQGVSRLVSLVPPVHVALVEPAQVIPGMDELFLFRRLAFYEGDRDMGSYMSFITGPSRTADIEMSLSIGVHGPREVHLVVIG